MTNNNACISPCELCPLDCHQVSRSRFPSFSMFTMYTLSLNYPHPDYHYLYHVGDFPQSTSTVKSTGVEFEIGMEIHSLYQTLMSIKTFVANEVTAFSKRSVLTPCTEFSLLNGSVEISVKMLPCLPSVKTTVRGKLLLQVT